MTDIRSQDAGSRLRPEIDIHISDFLEFGAQRVAITAANGLVKRGYRVRFVVLRDEGPFRSTLLPEVPCIELLSKSRWQPPRHTQLIAAATRYRRLCGDGKPRIVISFSPVTNALALVATRGLRRQKCVVQEHAFQSVAIKDASSYSPQFRALYRILALSYRFADRLICVSDALREDVCATFHVPRGNAQTIYNPVNRSLLSAMAHEESEVWPDRGHLKILAAGRIAPQKNFPRFLHVLAKLRESYPDLRFDAVLLGDGPDRSLVAQVRDDLGLRDCVSMPGFRSNPYPYIKNADVLCLTSEWEGLPMVIAEAMALGTVVVAHDCPSGPREMIGQGSGILAPFGDVVALAEALYEVRDPGVRQALCAEADKTVDRLFDEAAFLDQYERLIKSVWPGAHGVDW